MTEAPAALGLLDVAVPDRVTYDCSMSNNRVGTWVRESRKARGWNQTQVGTMAGVSRKPAEVGGTANPANPAHQDTGLLGLRFGSRSPGAFRRARVVWRSALPSATQTIAFHASRRSRRPVPGLTAFSVSAALGLVRRQ